MQIIYINFSLIPSKRAYSVGICKMAEAFQKQNAKTILILPSLKEEGDVWRDYDIKERFQIERIKVFDFLKLQDIMPFFIWKLVYYFGLFLFYLKAIFLSFPLIKKGKSVYYSRDFFFFL